MVGEYTLKRVCEELLPDIQSLYFSCFGLKVSLPELKAKYGTAAFGAQYIGYVAYDSSMRPAAHYSVFPIQINHYGKVVLAAQSGDTMTHPDHQKRGLFVALGKKTYALASQEGIEFVYGFPSPNSHQGLIRLGWEFHGRMQDVIITVSTLPLSGFAKTYPIFKPLYKAYSNLLLKSWPGQFEKFDRPSGFSVAKNQAFAIYKSKQNNRIVLIDGVWVWLKSDGWLMVGDFTTENIQDNQRFLKKLKQLARLLGCRKIVLSASQNSPLFNSISAMAPVFESLPIGIFPISPFDFENLSFTRLDYDTM